MKKNYFPAWDNQTAKRKVKAICTHCGAKQTAVELNYSLNYVACKRCKKEGCLTEKLN